MTCRNRRPASWLAVLFAAGCAGDGPPTAPEVAPVRVIAASAGLDFDPDGYVVHVGDRSYPVTPTDTLFLSLPIGDYRITLDGLAPNCTRRGSNARDVGVRGGAAAEAVFQVDCVATHGVVEVSVNSAGTEIPPAGYLLVVPDAYPHSPGLQVPPTAVRHVRIADGVATTSVRLQDVPANCTIDGDNPREVWLNLGTSARDTARTTFSVSCQPLASTGLLTVRVSTGGGQPDANGYLAALDCVPGFDDIPECRSLTPVSTNGTASVEVPATGAHSVELWDVAGNCRIVGPPVRSFVMQPSAPTAEVSFDVVCVAPGTVRLDLATSGSDLDADGYRVEFLDGANAVVGTVAPLPANGSVSAPVMPGTHRLRLAGVAFNCTPTGVMERTVTVPEGGTADVPWAVTCETAPELAFSAVVAGVSRVLRVRTNDGPPMAVGASDGSRPRWSPDGSRIAYTVNYGPAGGDELHVMNADGSGDARLTSHPADDADPDWSPDGRRLLFWSRRDGREQIYLVNADGTGLRRLITSAANDRDPVWSPDGQRIAFVRDGMIHVANADGSGIRRLTDRSLIGDNTPAWSPDGTRIAFMRWGCFDVWDCYGFLYLVGTDGSGLILAGDGSEPSWSPDGRWIAFTGAGGIEAVRLNSTDRRAIRTGVSGAGHPDWRP